MEVMTNQLIKDFTILQEFFVQANAPPINPGVPLNPPQATSSQANSQETPSRVPVSASQAPGTQSKATNTKNSHAKEKEKSTESNPSMPTGDTFWTSHSALNPRGLFAQFQGADSQYINANKSNQRKRLHDNENDSKYPEPKKQMSNNKGPDPTSKHKFFFSPVPVIDTVATSVETEDISEEVERRIQRTRERRLKEESGQAEKRKLDSSESASSLILPPTKKKRT
ncbi:hypothetical protein N7495_006372 [Penicillium taxi]|uniref:uncharacterized protein n=1 Tax=Penicillium taxi TaxID=168475 RepID=UPI00254511DF|nr:uncharacterized protein N7495_006372 [Penicillium taxi]KAJ5894681.1 hypothetical protein N7495_006372 [Penicillium taxi]